MIQKIRDSLCMEGKYHALLPWNQTMFGTSISMTKNGLFTLKISLKFLLVMSIWPKGFLWVQIILLLSPTSMMYTYITSPPMRLRTSKAVAISRQPAMPSTQINNSYSDLGMVRCSLQIFPHFKPKGGSTTRDFQTHHLCGKYQVPSAISATRSSLL